MPAFISGQSEKTGGADRGTATHRYMECFDFSPDNYDTAYLSELERMKNKGLLTEEEAKIISKKEVQKFLSSSLAKRMHIALLEKKLHREAAFVMSETPSVLTEENMQNNFTQNDYMQNDSQLTMKKSSQVSSGEIKNDNKILIQGIIDVFFEEKNGIILVDYKTDRVKDGETLIRRYESQMKFYANAIERTHDKKVVETILYSFALGKEVKINV